MSQVVSKQLDAWIEEHGSARDALNVALARLEKAQSALERTEIGGIYAEFWDVPDAIEQMALHIKETSARLKLAILALEKVEWICFDWEVCPWCYAESHEGHSPDCARQIALGA